MVERTNPAVDFCRVRRCIAARVYFGPDDPRTTRIEAAAPPGAQRILRDVSGGTTTGWGSPFVGAERGTVAAFVQALQTRAILPRLLADGTVIRCPFYRR